MLLPNYEYQSDFARKYYGLGKAEGLTEGLAEGLAEGSAKARRETLINIITRLLGLRFGPLDDVTLSRLEAATNAELEQVVEHLLTAPTLDAALGATAERIRSTRPNSRAR